MKKSLFVGIATATFLFQGCAHVAAERRVDEKLTAEQGITSRTEIGNEMKKLISESSSLSQEQRDQLTDLRRSTSQELDSIRDQSLKLRSLLVKELITKNYDNDEVQVIESRIKELESQRVTTILAAVEKTNQILGREVEHNPHFYRDFLDVHRAE